MPQSLKEKRKKTKNYITKTNRISTITDCTDSSFALHFCRFSRFYFCCCWCFCSIFRWVQKLNISNRINSSLISRAKCNLLSFNTQWRCSICVWLFFSFFSFFAHISFRHIGFLLSCYVFIRFSFFFLLPVDAKKSNILSRAPLVPCYM